jgi:hypothetical protein
VVPSRSLGSLERRDFLLVEDVEQGTRNKELEGAAQAPWYLPVLQSGSLVPSSLFLVPNLQEAPLVSDVASRTEADATRDRAVVRTGEGPAIDFPTREARATLLALLLT